MLLRWDPFRELDRLAEAPARRPAVPIDAVRRGDRLHIDLDLPGVDPSSVELTVEKNVLTIRAERHWQPGDDDEVLMAERPRGVFTRQLFLGDNLDTDAIEAHAENGVLHVVIPMAEAAKPRRIEVNRGDGGSTPIEASSTQETTGSARSSAA